MSKEVENEPQDASPEDMSQTLPNEREFSNTPAMQDVEDWTDLRSLSTLGRAAGVPEHLLPRLVFKELMDNAMDEGSKVQHGTLAEGGTILGLFVEDDGPGFPGSDEDVARLFSARRGRRSTKYLRLPKRGNLGNGLRVVTGAALASGGSLVVTTRKRRLVLRPQIDGSTSYERSKDARRVGTRIEVHFGPALQRIATADEELRSWVKQALALWGGKTYEGTASLHWFESDAFAQLAWNFQGSVRELVERFNGCTGRKASLIAEGFQGRRADKLSREELDQVLSVARRETRPIPARRLGQVGKLEGLPSAYACSRSSFRVETANGRHDAEIPVVIEAWAKVGSKPAASICVNRTPIASEIGCRRDKGVYYVYVANVGRAVEVGRGREFEIIANVTAPYVPIVNDGKTPDLGSLWPAFAATIEKAVRRARRETRADAKRGNERRTQIVEVMREVLEELHPMTVRQVYYQLVSRRVIENKDSCYKEVSRLLRDARKEGAIAWEWIEDRLRRPRHVSMWADLAKYAQGLPGGYRRDVWASQPRIIELWLEKDALSGIFQEALAPYGAPLNVGRGFGSWTAIQNAAERWGDGSAVSVLVFGDFDPSGEDIVRFLREGLKYFDCQPELVKIGLTAEDIDRYELPPLQTKKSDSRSASFVAKHGDRAVELDALRPDILRQRIVSEVEARMNLAALAKVRRIEARERARLTTTLAGLSAK